MSKIVKNLKTGKENAYHIIMLLISAPLWLVVVGFIVAAVLGVNQQLSNVVWLYVWYGVGIALFYLISSAVYRATAFGNMILLSENQFPDLHAMVVDGSKAVGLEAPPKAFLYNSNGLFNAFARRLLGGRYIFLTSALVDASSDEQVRFVIGHELGHHAAGHLNPWLNTFKLPAHLVPFLAPAYSRSREFTCDQVGAYLSGDVVASRTALQMLGCGCRRLNASMSCEAFLAQERMVPPVFGFITEKFRTHPRLTRRVAAIKDAGPVRGR